MTSISQSGPAHTITVERIADIPELSGTHAASNAAAVHAIVERVDGQFVALHATDISRWWWAELCGDIREAARQLVGRLAQRSIHHEDLRYVPEPSPLTQAEDAKRRRDFRGEVEAIQDGARSLASAPWYPARPGDIVHVRFEEIPGVLPAFGETYLIEATEAGPDGWLAVTMLASSVAPELGSGDDGFATDCDPDPLMTMWVEAGPQALTIVRDGAVVHLGGAR